LRKPAILSPNVISDTTFPILDSPRLSMMAEKMSSAPIFLC